MMSILFSLGVVAAIRVLSPLFREGANVLILFNNTDEMRGSGGFTSAYMTITRQKDTFVTHFGSSYEIDTPPSEQGAVLVVPPPRPMQAYMDIDRWSFRDANWSPDYPTSAQAASQFYTQITKAAPPLYVITVNMTAARTLMQHLPPLSIGRERIDALTPDDCSPTTNADRTEWNIVCEKTDILDWLRDGWSEDASGPEGDKSFLKERVNQLIAAIRRLDILYQVDVIPALFRMLSRGDILIYSSDAQMQSFFAARGWSGPFPFPIEGDIILYSENNIGYNKTSSSLKREFLYEVDFSQTPPVAALTITYTAGPPPLPSEPIEPAPIDPRLSECKTVDSVGALELGVPTYDDRMIGCAWIYAQIYPLPGSKLTDYDIPSIPADQFPFGLRGQTGRIDALQDGGVRGWGYVMVIPYGETHTVTLTYTLPDSVSDVGYTIALPAIAGMSGHWTIQVHPRDNYAWARTMRYDMETRQFYHNPFDR